MMLFCSSKNKIQIFLLNKFIIVLVPNILASSLFISFVIIQTIPTFSPSKLAQIIKSITAREIFKLAPDVKKQLWGGEFWTKGYFINTVSQHGNEDTIRNYVKNQGSEKQYNKIHSQQISML